MLVVSSLVCCLPCVECGLLADAFFGVVCLLWFVVVWCLVFVVCCS